MVQLFLSRQTILLYGSFDSHRNRNRIEFFFLFQTTEKVRNQVKPWHPRLSYNQLSRNYHRLLEDRTRIGRTMEGLPFLPGYTFHDKDPTKTRYHVHQVRLLLRGFKKYRNRLSMRSFTMWLWKSLKMINDLSLRTRYDTWLIIWPTTKSFKVPYFSLQTTAKRKMRRKSLWNNFNCIISIQ